MLNRILTLIFAAALFSACVGTQSTPVISSQSSPATDFATPSPTARSSPSLPATPAFIALPGTTTPAPSPGGVKPTSNDLSRVAITPGTYPQSCDLLAFVVPTLPAQIPGYSQLDSSTGLHITGHYKVVDPKTYRLKIIGKVKNPLNLTVDQLRCMPKIKMRTTLICPGNFEDYPTFAGVPLHYLLDLAEIETGATQIEMTAADLFTNQVDLPVALKEDNFLAYEWQDQPLPILHGFPVRAVFPSLPGNKWVKWLKQIEVK